MDNKKWFRSLLWRRALICLVLLLQIGLLVYLTLRGDQSSRTVSAVLRLVSFLVCLSIMSKREKDAFKLSWVFLILMFPVFGGLFYLLLTVWNRPKRDRQRAETISRETKPLYLLPGDRLEELCHSVPARAAQLRYLQRYAGFPVYTGTDAEYLPSGEAKFQAMLRELQKAEHYIFLEYFIVENGEMWGSILKLLEEKAAQGVEVRVLYDDIGCLLRLPTGYPQELEAKGIRCRVFNPFRAFLSSIQNNRDHRKICVVDGKSAITGGVNLADEYINAVDRFGHWKDAAVLITGEAAWSITLMFQEMWAMVTGKDENFAAYYPWQDAPCPVKGRGMVQPYGDTPLDQENVCEHVYRQILDTARDYVYITTPYLILDATMLSSLSLAAKSGVDVRIITPHRWDKFLVHMTTRTYYRQLLDAGVRIYEYTPGFMHAKTFVSDNSSATVGTCNLDYRSLYQHFECGVYLYGTPAVTAVRDDFLATLEKCQEIYPENCRENLPTRLFREILHVFAPLM